MTHIMKIATYNFNLTYGYDTVGLKQGCSASVCVYLYKLQLPVSVSNCHSLTGTGGVYGASTPVFLSSREATNRACTLPFCRVHT